MNDHFELVSPCVGVCTLDPDSGYCRGCWRTVDEIASWPGQVDDEKVVVLRRLQDRRSAAGLPSRRRTRRQKRRAGEGL